PRRRPKPDRTRGRQRRPHRATDGERTQWAALRHSLAVVEDGTMSPIVPSNVSTHAGAASRMRGASHRVSAVHSQTDAPESGEPWTDSTSSPTGRERS